MVDEPDKDPFIPIIDEVDGALVSNMCIWCGSQEKLSRSHIFPKSVGGRVAPQVSCELCNNFLGHKYENLAFRNVFITAGMVKLGLLSKRDAYRFGKIVDESTQAEVHIGDDSKVRAIPKKLGDKAFIGSPSQRKKYFVEQLKKKHPGEPTKPVEDFFDDTTSTEMTYLGTKYKTTTRPEEKVAISIQKLTRDPNPKLIFKIVYECLACLNLLAHPWIRRELKKYVTVNTTKGKDRIEIYDTIYPKVISNTTTCFREYKQLEEIPFRPFNYLNIRISKDFLIYIDVTIFGQLKSFFILGKWDQLNDELNAWFNKVMVFPLEGSLFEMPDYPNLRFKDHVQVADASIDLREWQINNEKSKK